MQLWLVRTIWTTHCRSLDGGPALPYPTLPPDFTNKAKPQQECGEGAANPG